MLRYRRQLASSCWAMHFYALSTSYLMLFNPRTENSTYAMLAPVIGLCCGRELFIERRTARAVAFALLALLILGSYEIGRLLTSVEQAVWLSPVVTIVFASGVFSAVA